MKKFKLLAFGMMCSVLLLQAQDAEIMAMAYYSKAEQMYTMGNYENALRKLSEAEKLMSPNPKILYLKVSILNKLNSKSASYRNDLTESITQFFAITDKNTYPREKYMDIVGIKIDMDDTQSKSVGTYTTTSTNGSVSGASSVDIEAEYNRIKNSKKISDLENFLFNHKNSKYEDEIRTKFNVIKDEWNVKQELERQKLIFTTSNNNDNCDAIKDMSTFLLVKGSVHITCVLKGLFTYPGNIEIHVDRAKARNEVTPFTSFMNSKSPVCVKQNVEINGRGTYTFKVIYNRNVLVLQREVYVE